MIRLLQRRRDIDFAGGQPAAWTTKGPAGGGHAAPNFVMTNVDSSLSRCLICNQPVVLNFWATWYPPTAPEMPDLVKAYGPHKDSGLVIVSINDETKAKAFGLMDQYGIGSP